MTTDGLVNIRSLWGPQETMARLAAEIETRGMTIYARIDHAAFAAEVGIPLRPSDLLIFGNPRAGMPLMESVPTIAIDLPLKALVWQDIAGNTWVSYNDPAWIARRHSIEPGREGTTAAMSAVLDAIATGASSRPVPELAPLDMRH